MQRHQWAIHPTDWTKATVSPIRSHLGMKRMNAGLS